MNLFPPKPEAQIHIQKYIDLSVKYENVYFMTPPSKIEDRIKIKSEDYVYYEDEELLIHFEVDMTNNFFTISRDIYINGVKSNLKGLKKFIN